MATSDTTSGLTQWAPLSLWTQSSSSSSQPSVDASDSIIVTTTSRSLTMDGVAARGNMSMSSTQSNMEGRVGKSGRRRSRASRRAPTTMLNTDTANFRSMVQQFTGIMSGPGPYPYPIVDPHSITGYNFNEPESAHRPSARAMPMELQQQQQYQYQYHARERQQASQNETFLPELNNSSANLDQVGDEFFADAMYAQWMPTSRPTSDPNIKLDDDFVYY